MRMTEGSTGGATFVFWMGRREIWLLNKLAKAGLNHIALTVDSEGTSYHLNGVKVAYLSRNPLQPSVFCVPLPSEWVAELTKIDIEEIRTQGQSSN